MDKDLHCRCHFLCPLKDVVMHRNFFSWDIEIVSVTRRGPIRTIRNIDVVS